MSSTPQPTARFLGTGWSHGVPVIGCDCPVCTNPHPRNHRRRPSLLLQGHGVSLLIDTSPDFRDQALTFNIRSLDAVFFTHEHADHLMGFDDIRRFTWDHDHPLPVYADPHTLQRLHVIFPYISPTRIPGKAVPRVEFRSWTEPTSIGPFTLTPFPVPHTNLPCFGILIQTPHARMGYIPDCSGLSPGAQDLLRGADHLVLNALRRKPHPAHLTLHQSLDLLHHLAPAHGYLTHMGCDFDYPTLNPTLPPSIEMAWDGLTIPL